MDKQTFLDLMDEKQASKGRNYEYIIDGNEVKSSHYILVKCLDHGEEKKSQVVNLRAGKAPCKQCAKIARHKGRVDSFDTVKNKIKLAFGDEYFNNLDLSQSVYVNSQTKMQIGCIKHNQTFQVIPSSLVQGKYFCPDCQYEHTGVKKRWSSEEIIEEFNKVHNNTYVYEKDSFTNYSTKMKMYCPEHDEDFYMTPNKHLSGQIGCKACLSQKFHVSLRTPFEEFLREAKVNQYNGQYYTYYEDDFNSRYDNLVKFTCNKHGDTYEQPKKSHKKGNTACRECVNDWLRESTIDQRLESIQNKFETIWGDRFEYLWDTYTSYMIPMKIRCKEHNKVFEQTPDSHAANHIGCVHCQMSGISQLELDIHEYIESFGFTVLQNKRSLLGDGSEVDIYIPELKLGFEVNGNYWHSDYLNKKFRNYHKVKLDAAHSKGIDLCFIWEYEWDNRKDLMKEYIKNKLGVNTGGKIYARNTYIKVADKEDISSIKDFINDNHIQGAPKFISKAVCLHDKESNDLVAAMLFKRGTNDGQWVLQRYCTKYNVVGGASKCLKYFESNYKPSQIISFSDRQHFSGNLYEILGFEFESEVAPSYVVFSNKTRDVTHKANWRRKSIQKRLDEYGIEDSFDPELDTRTEFDVQDQYKFFRLWDAGKIKWVKNYRQ